MNTREEEKNTVIIEHLIPLKKILVLERQMLCSNQREKL